MKSVSYLQVLMPNTESNVEASQKLTERAQATLTSIQELEKSLGNTHWWQRKLVWVFGMLSLASLLGYMYIMRCTPTIPAPVASPILDTVKSIFQNTVGEETKPGVTTNIFLDHPLTCLSIVAVTAITVIGFKGSFKIVRWSVSSLRKMKP